MKTVFYRLRDAGQLEQSYTEIGLGQAHNGGSSNPGWGAKRANGLGRTGWLSCLILQRQATAASTRHGLCSDAPPGAAKASFTCRTQESW